jgi:hypothetical protein
VTKKFVDRKYLILIEKIMSSASAPDPANAAAAAMMESVELFPTTLAITVAIPKNC